MEIDKVIELQLKIVQIEQERARLEQELNIANTKEKNETQRINQEMIDRASARMFGSVITYGHSALKTTVLINGAAAIGVFTFLGNAANKGAILIKPDAVAGISYFGYGVLMGALAIGLTYAVQCIYAYILNCEAAPFFNPEIDITLLKKRTKKFKVLAHCLHIFIVIIAAMSYYFFYAGATTVAHAF